MINRWIILLLCVFGSKLIMAQNSFFFPYSSTSGEKFEGFTQMDNGDYAVATSNSVFRYSSSGSLTGKKDIKDGTSSYIQSVCGDHENNLWVAVNVFNSQGFQDIVIYKLDRNNQVIFRKELPMTFSVEMFKLFRSSTNRMMLFFKETDFANVPMVTVIGLNGNGGQDWAKTVSSNIVHLYAVKNMGNGVAGVCYMDNLDQSVWLSKIDATGQFTKQKIAYPFNAAAPAYTQSFCLAPDNGLVFVGQTDNGQVRFPDALVYKMAADGKLEWEKKLNIYASDGITDVAAVSDGYILFGWSGLRDLGNDVDGDILLVKLDLQGNLVWKNAFGSEKVDYPVQLTVTSDAIFFGCQVSYPGKAATVPALGKVRLDGLLPTVIPFTLQPGSSMIPVEIKNNQTANTFVGAAPDEQGNIISAGYSLNTTDDNLYPFIVKHDAAGKEQWHKQLQLIPGVLVANCKARNNDYLAVIEHADLFNNSYDLVQYNSAGVINWTKSTSANFIKDVIGVSDGGYLLVGAEAINLVNLELVLIKLDATGQEQWRKLIGTQNWEMGRKVIETPQKEFVIVGNKQVAFDVISTMYVVKTDALGNRLWEKEFTSGMATTTGYAVTMTADGDYIFAGSDTRIPFINKNIRLVKTNNQGTVIWEKPFDIHLEDEGFILQNTSDRGLFVAGTTGQAVVGNLEKFGYVMNINQQGELQWSKYYGKKNHPTRLQSFVTTGNGDTLVMGTTQPVYGTQQPFLVSLKNLPDNNGDNNRDSIVIYPNPVVSNGRVSVFIQSDINQSIAVSLYDMSGRKAGEWLFNKNGPSLLEELPVTSLASGIYIMNIQIGTKKYTRKLVVVSP